MVAIPAPANTESVLTRGQRQLLNNLPLAADRGHRGAPQWECTFHCGAQFRGISSASETAKAARQFADQVLWVDAQLTEHALVFVGVDLVGQFLLGLVGFVVISLALEVIEDLLLINLHCALLQLFVRYRPERATGVRPLPSSYGLRTAAA